VIAVGLGGHDQVFAVWREADLTGVIRNVLGPLAGVMSSERAESAIGRSPSSLMR